MRVLENRVPRRIFGMKGVEVTGEEFHDLYSSPSIITMIKSSRMDSMGHVARIRDNMYLCI
jgi:hypothetical protein